MSLKLAPTALAVFLSTLIVTFVFVGINIKAFGLAITFGSLLMIGVRSLQNNYYIPDDRILNPEIYLEAFMGVDLNADGEYNEKDVEILTGRLEDPKDTDGDGVFTVSDLLHVEADELLQNEEITPDVITDQITRNEEEKSEELFTLTNATLRDMLKERKLPISGNKAALVERLITEGGY
jgi:hypothetical protein